MDLLAVESHGGERGGQFRERPRPWAPLASAAPLEEVMRQPCRERSLYCATAGLSDAGGGAYVHEPSDPGERAVANRATERPSNRGVRREGDERLVEITRPRLH